MITLANKTLLIDLDGTMYRGNRVIPEAITFIQRLQKHHVPYVFVTNNATRTPKQNVDHMKSLGFTGIKPEAFFTSAMAAVAHMKRISKAEKVFCIGEAGLQEAVAQGGYQIDEEGAELVFVGLDRYADFSLYSRAARCLRHNHAMLVGTNGDRRVPDGDSFFIGNGAVLEMLQYASEVERINIGKPSSIMMEETLAYIGRQAGECIVLGDNLETDITFGKHNGVMTIMVTSGVHTRTDAERCKVQPDILIDSLDELHIK